MTSTLKRTEISRSIRSILLGSSAALALSAGGTALAADSGDLETPPSLTGSGDINALKEQVQTLMDRIDELEQQQATSDQQLSEMKDQVDTVPANVVTAGDIPGSFKIPGSDTSVSVSGYVKGDLTYDLDADLGDSFSLVAVPNDGAPSNENVRLHAKQSRLRVQSQTELGNGGAINTHLEGDFFGAGGNELFSNSSALRIRHAYASWDTGTGGNFLAGQTWTLFGGFFYGPTVDFFAPNGQIFARQGQVRYTMPGGFALSLENPESTVFDAEGPFSGGGQDEFPDLVAKWSGAGISISGILRELNGRGTGADGIPYDDTATAWGVSVGGAWDFDPVSFTAGVTYGDGLGRYLLANTSGVGGVAVGGELETVEHLGVTTGVSFATSESSSVNFSAGYSELDDEFAGVMPTFEESGVTLHANYMWSPWPGSNLGIELIWGDREQFNGAGGDATRIHFGAQQSF